MSAPLRTIPLRTRNQSALRVLQSLYCQGDYGRCARYKLASRGEVPPLTLLPDGRHMGAKSA
ncbi:MAG: hypothetical protein H6721_08490 [Sandaracinus sp.]|nr:hypothetical protein [Sandaracinus sp.]MCB9621224.1 hypothetical protein [Sandaracinus sp.]MCB9625180.1 hypothetical protein [Sandaracinus sp.]MCB9632154.1 hypothetical protein [Sandaracinus sp.]